MRGRIIIILAALFIGTITAEAQKKGPSPLSWNFDSDRVDQPPAGFTFARTGGGRLGQWIVRSEKDAPSGTNVLAQINTDKTDYRFPVAVAEAPSLRDLTLSVRCKPVSGEIDQACGLVFRYRDENNYYITRANALEDNVCFYDVKGGRRRRLACWNGKVTSGAWHTLKADALGDRFEVDWDGKKVIEVRDQTFSDAGKVGVWTKADSVTYFDDLRVAPLGS